jgi:hypothetical protein
MSNKLATYHWIAAITRWVGDMIERRSVGWNQQTGLV